MVFDKFVDRRGTYCTQWDYIEDRFGKGYSHLIPFTISDTDFKIPEEVQKALSKAINHGIFGYSRWNHDDYKGAVSAWVSTRHEAITDSEWVVYSPSVLYSINLLLKLILPEGSAVMTHTPKYDGFSKLLKYRRLVEIPLREFQGTYITDFDLIEDCFKNKGVKVFLLCNPDNPTGKVWTKDELSNIIRLCSRYNVFLLSDEIHIDIFRKRAISILSITQSNCAVVSSPSKTFNTASLGGSYAFIPDSFLRNSFIEYSKNIDNVSSPSIMSVISTIVAYNKCGYWVDKLNDYIFRNCQYVISELDGYKGLRVQMPEATYLMWIDFSSCDKSPEEFKQSLMDKGGVAIMMGENYGDKYRIRLNVGCPMCKLEKGVKGIKLAL